MRLWSIHPKYLDKSGIVSLWRESLLAQNVLHGKTKGYKNHPQLRRFRNHANTQKAIANYLIEIWRESKRRGYKFDKTKIGTWGKTDKTNVTQGRIKYEFDLLREKLKKRDLLRHRKLLSVKEKEIKRNPFFKLVEGQVEEWEKLDAFKNF